MMSEIPVGFAPLTPLAHTIIPPIIGIPILINLLLPRQGPHPNDPFHPPSEHHSAMLRVWSSYSEQWPCMSPQSYVGLRVTLSFRVYLIQTLEVPEFHCAVFRN